jgi:hypothetical protein
MTPFIVEITKSIRAPKNNNGTLEFKTFLEGTEVEVVEFNQPSSTLNYIATFKTTDGFIIPKQNAIVLKQKNMYRNFNQEPIQEANVVTPEAPIVAVEVPVASDVVKKASKQVSYALAGGVSGFVIAAFMGKNKWLYALTGIATGFAVATALTKK